MALPLKKYFFCSFPYKRGTIYLKYQTKLNTMAFWIFIAFPQITSRVSSYSSYRSYRYTVQKGQISLYTINKKKMEYRYTGKTLSRSCRVLYRYKRYIRTFCYAVENPIMYNPGSLASLTS